MPGVCSEGTPGNQSHPDGTLYHILTVDVRGNKLVGGVPVFFDTAELLAFLVVKDAAVNGEAPFLEAGVDVVVGGNWSLSW